MTVNQRKQGIRLPLRKNTVSGQTSYTYHTASGDITLTRTADGRLCVTNTCEEAGVTSYVIDADGVTLDLLQDLHRADNREVENNLRHARAFMTEREKQDIEAWRSDPAYPERQRMHLFPENYQRWNQPIDTMSEDVDGTSAADRDSAMLRAWENAQPEEDKAREYLRAFVSTLPERQQQIYQLHILEERTLQEAAEIMGVTHQRASAVLKQLKRNLETHFRKKVF